MNAVEIEEAISLLAEQDFDAENFPYAFLEAFGNKPATITRSALCAPHNSSAAKGSWLPEKRISIDRSVISKQNSYFFGFSSTQHHLCLEYPI
ncbi:type IIL restriction-modification enzyme MmeI [Neptunomonas sp.]|uniref:type IIL restriction-modification enzyme MmeI n=1 Tax=Neptunomonas TaxID=75687 RepID=UPI00351613DA